MRLILASLALLATALPAFAENCPVGEKSCKVITLTPSEESAMMSQTGILSTAAQARKLDLGDIAAYFAEKIKNAPAGTIVDLPKTPEAKSDPNAKK